MSGDEQFGREPHSLVHLIVDLRLQQTVQRAAAPRRPPDPAEASPSTHVTISPVVKDDGVSGDKQLGPSPDRTSLTGRPTTRLAAASTRCSREFVVPAGRHRTTPREWPQRRGDDGPTVDAITEEGGE